MAPKDTATTDARKLQFQTEARQLLHLMIHSLYSHKEVFLRELISNASDALDRLRFESLTDTAIVQAGEPAIRVQPNKKARTLTISDNGIGMTRQEVIDNIGTIARSGSKAFVEKLTGDQKADSNLIGQFGVGFYSVFMVASRVKLVSKRAGSDEPAVVWESDGESEYTLGTTERAEHGTEITLYLNNDGSQYAETFELRSIIKRYSDFVAFPIYLPDDKGKEAVVNETKPIWKRKAAEVTAEQYASFYQQTLGGFGEPLETMHVAAEGAMEYAALLCIPGHAPVDMFSYERKHGIRLYVKRVFITDDCKELMPEYLRFVRGVVDSEDLPLNVSREILQHNPIIGRIRRALVGKLLNQLKDMTEQKPDAYATFWKQFGPVLKEGLHSDHENRERLLELARFQSSAGATADELVSLRQYIERMKEGQKDIYYIVSESRALAEKSPHLETLRDKGVEVLLLVDPVDEFVMGDITEYDTHAFVSVTKGGLDLGALGTQEQQRAEQAEGELRKLAERMKNVLADEVKDVRVSNRLRSSLSCLVNDEHEMGAQMERLMKAMNREFTPHKRILEINGTHPVLRNLNALYEKDAMDPRLQQWARLLYEQALIAEGLVPPDTQAYGARVSELLLDVSGRAAAAD